MVKLTGIHNTDLLSERPLSVVLKEFLTWISTTTKEYAESTGKDWNPGTVNSQGGVYRFQTQVLVAHNGQVRLSRPLRGN